MPMETKDFTGLLRNGLNGKSCCSPPCFNESKLLQWNTTLRDHMLAPDRFSTIPWALSALHGQNPYQHPSLPTVGGPVLRLFVFWDVHPRSRCPAAWPPLRLAAWSLFRLGLDLWVMLQPCKARNGLCPQTSHSPPLGLSLNSPSGILHVMGIWMANFHKKWVEAEMLSVSGAFEMRSLFK